ncbi:MAG TPA: nicotinamide riboside transporter PnuC [Opitutus sp.]|nr:nicotinamide riboside transporter PnuC [Opitutus sp.]
MSFFEILGTVLGVVGVWLMIRQNVWTWPVGLVQVTVSAWVFFEARLYSDVLLQLIYIAIQAYGWWHWLHPQGRAHAELPVTRLSVRAMVGWSAAGAIGTAAWGEFMRRNTDAALPHWDAFILAFSLIAQWLQARKRLENWATWMIVNLVAVGVYWTKDLRLFAGLYALFFAMAVAGHVEWRRSMKAGEGEMHA